MRIFAVPFLFLGIWSVNAHPEVLPWTYGSILQHTLEKSPTVQRAQEEWKAARWESENALRAWWPTLDLQGTHGRQGDSRLEPSTTWRSEAGILLKENLYDNGESYKKSRIQSLRQQIAEARYENVRAQAIMGVSDDYLNFCLAQRKFKLTQDYAQEISKQFQWVSDQFRNGIRTRKDYLRFKAQNQRSELEVVTSQNDIEKARLDLIEKMALPSPESQNFSCAAAEQRTSLQVLNVDFSPQLLSDKTLQWQRQISDLQVDVTKRKYWPEIFLTAEAGYGSNDYLEPARTWQTNEGTYWNALVTFKWNLWDWGLRRRNIEIQRAREKITLSTQEAAVLSEQKAWQKFKTDLKVFLSTYKTVKELEKMEVENFQLLQRDYRMGQLGYLELITAMSNYVSAQTQSVQFDYDLKRQILKSKFYQGKLDEKGFE